jgi:adenylate cyclase
MDDARLNELTAWITKAGLVGTSENAMLSGFCQRAVAAGLPLARGTVLIDTLHPIHEGRGYRWRIEAPDETNIIEYGRTSEGEAAEAWRASPFYQLLQTGESMLRRHFAAGAPADFRSVEDVRAEGMTDYVALIHRFSADGVIGEMDCIYSYWATAAPAGFSDDGIAALRRVLTALVLAMKCAALARIAETLVETYLGRDAGRQVLRGRIARGVTDRISAALWFSDLRGFTRITDTAPPGQIIPMLNDYAEAVISAIHDEGGDVLKLIGDGVLAIFKADDPAQACRCALAAAVLARRRVARLNARRRMEELPITNAYLGLHIGEVFYGNIGSKERLDFTVVGPAVNEASRIAAMCRSADQEILLSSAFVAAVAADERRQLVSVGRYALRGVGHAQELFTLDPSIEPSRN